jgi:CheY-like chemotaxis protein
MTTDGVILLVEDSEDDVFLMKRALKGAGIANRVVVVTDGEQATNYLAGEAEFGDRAACPMPSVVFLDLKLPLRSGHEVLGWIRGRKELESLVVVVLTSSDEPSDLRRAYSLGANSYLVKPLTPKQLTNLADAFNWSWLKYDRPAETAPANKPAAGER